MMKLPVIFLCAVSAYSAQPPTSPDPDYLVLNDGEKVIGQLERATDSTVTFKSTVLGELSIGWDKVKELHSSSKFAVIPKNVVLQNRREIDAAAVGPIALQEKSISVKEANSEKSVPLVEIGALVSGAEYAKAQQPLGWLGGWAGGATGGIALTEATQKNQSFSGAANLIRTAPAVSWLNVQSKTLINFNSAYSKLTQPGTPDVKTSLIHFSVEQDWYLNPRLFLFGAATLDHSFSQGIKLQQDYGGGVGYVLLKTATQELDARASVNYIDQTFEAGPGTQLIGSQFGETYMRKFLHGILLNEQASFTPSWNDTRAFTTIGTAGLTFPVYHQLGFTVGALDSYINNPPPGFRKNSFQLTVGATYSLK